MKSTTTTATALAVALFTSLASTAALPSHATFHPRSLHTDASSLASSTYDYVIVGGGLAGLVVANRLSSNPNISVAVIEAGSSGYGDNSKFTTPAANLYDSAVGTAYDWRWSTSPQSGLAGRSASWPRGKVLGGSSAINGLYYVRHSEVEQQAWDDLIGGDDEWSWQTMLSAMKKSETFTPAGEIGFDVPYNASSHGTDGPVHVSYPATSYPQVSAFLQSTSNVGIAASTDPDSGQSWGAFLATSNINPANWTRSFSRTAYYDPITYRPNLDVLTDHLVTKITFNSTAAPAVADGVQFARYSGGPVGRVSARKEVILCGGAVNDPQILQLSGVGDRELLERVGVEVVVDLPGVGYHLQDHLSTGVVWSPSGAGGQGAMPPTSVTGNATLDSYVNSAIAYVSGSTIFGQSQWTSLIDSMKAARDGSVEAYDAPAAVKLGYNATYGVQVDRFFPSSIGPVELLFALSFGGVQVQAALQHPLSRGSITVNSTDPFSPPVIDPAYLSHESDMVILREGFKLARKVGEAQPLSTYVGSENAPGTGVETDAQWESWIRRTVGTEFHPSSTCSMLPREWGGVVGKDLKVYGVQNVRVVDASVPPVSFSAHLMSVVYGLAERGSEMVLEDWESGMVAGAGTNTSAASGGSGGSGTGAGGSRGNTTTTTTSQSSAAQALSGKTMTEVMAAVALVVAVLAL